jgi:hypothetical protein
MQESENNHSWRASPEEAAGTGGAGTPPGPGFRKRSASGTAADARNEIGAGAARLVDVLLDYVQSRQGDLKPTAGGLVDQEQLVRAVFRHLWRHPIPTALLGVSTAWLLLSANEPDEEEQAAVGEWRHQASGVTGENLAGEPLEEDFVERFEDELVEQVKGGYGYTRQRLQEVVRRYPWATGAAVLTGGLLAATLLPQRHPKSKIPVSPEPVSPPEVDPCCEEIRPE